MKSRQCPWHTVEPIVRYRRYLRQGEWALQADPQTTAWRRRTYQRTWQRQKRNQRLESAWQERCRDTIAIVRHQEEWGWIGEFNFHKLLELTEHSPWAQVRRVKGFFIPYSRYHYSDNSWCKLRVLLTIFWLYLYKYSKTQSQTWKSAIMMGVVRICLP